MDFKLSNRFRFYVLLRPECYGITNILLYYHMVAVFLCCTYMCCCLCFHFHALGPTPTGVTVSPSGCQSLQVNWTHRAPTPPLTLSYYRVLYKSHSGSFQNHTTSSEGSYTITGLAPATAYTVAVEAQTQLGYGSFCCTPTATTQNGEASSDAHGSLLNNCISCQLVIWYTACMSLVLYTYLRSAQSSPCHPV